MNEWANKLKSDLGNVILSVQILDCLFDGLKVSEVCFLTCEIEVMIDTITVENIKVPEEASRYVSPSDYFIFG